METTPPSVDHSAAHPLDMDIILVLAAGVLALAALALATQRYNPAPLDPEAGWFLCP